MKLGVFFEMQVPRPWHDGLETQRFDQALAQAELADRLGYDYAWTVEHHFLEEYSHGSAPEILLGAMSQRTKQIRLGHGIVVMPPNFNPPARVAERIAMLDILSHGRVEFGTGASSSRVELEGFRIDPTQKQAMWEEATEQVVRMMTEVPYLGYEGKYFSMPARNVVPKPVQKPHPPMWLACSNRETIRTAARLGLGALTFVFVDAAEAALWVNEYYEIFKRECSPISQVVNPNVALVNGFMCHENGEEAVRRGLAGQQFFMAGLGHYYAEGVHVPGRTDLWATYSQRPGKDAPTLIGSTDFVRERLMEMENVGVDQVILMHHAGNTLHEHSCESLELFAQKLLPEFKARGRIREQQKAEELAPFVRRALERRKTPAPAGDIPEVRAYGRTIAVAKKS
jgi:alkanesulfonate monooxygenase SsuD/methylene tetrahydromethanopterin reductase-like flavin-dependent oxidoreductase (luciferase family)